MGIYASPLTEIVTRLNYHVGSGKILDGYNWTDVPVEDVEGVDDLPSVRMFLPDVTETFRPARHGNSTMSVRFALSVKKSTGIPAMMEAVEKLIDAIETNTSDEVDTGLAGTTMRPIAFRVATPFHTKVSLNAPVTVDIMPRPFDRGNRRSL